MAAGSTPRTNVDPAFGWDPLVGAWRIVLAPPGPAGCCPLVHDGGVVLVDLIDGSVLEAIAETADGSPAGAVEESAVLLWRRLFGDNVANWLAGSGAEHDNWRYAPVGQPTDSEAQARSALGRLAIVLHSLDVADAPSGVPTGVSVFAIEIPQLAAVVRLASEQFDEIAAESAELLDDESLSVVGRSESLEPVRAALEAGGYVGEELPALVRGEVVGHSDQAGSVADRLRTAFGATAANVSSWFDPPRRELFAAWSSVRSAGRANPAGSGDGLGFGMGLASSQPVQHTPSPLSVVLVELPADRLVDWDAAVDGRSWAARVSFRGSSVPHLDADLVDSNGDLVASTPFTMESVGVGQVQLRAEGRLPDTPPFDELTVRVRGVDLDPDELDLSSLPSDRRLHATSLAASAAGAGRWALAGAQLAHGVDRDSPAPPDVLEEFRWVANRWNAAADAWSTAGADAGDRRVGRCRELAGSFNSVADQLGSSGSSAELEQLAGQLQVGWSERVTRLLASTLAAEWGGRNRYDTTPELAERSARRAALIGDHVQAESARTTQATQLELPQPRRQLAAQLALWHRACAGRLPDPELERIAGGPDSAGGRT